MTTSAPIARGPLIDFHRQAGATLQLVEGWEIAVRYPQEPDQRGNALIDISHKATWEINGRDTGAALQTLCGADVPLRTIHPHGDRQVYRLTPDRAIAFGGGPIHLAGAATALDVTGGWASFALLGPDRERILNKLTAVDVRERTLPLRGCCQGPIFGVNTLFGRFANRFELHVCTDSALFFHEVLRDAGSEFHLRLAGGDYYRKIV